MKSKILAVSLLVLALIVCFAACERPSTDADNTTPGDGDTHVHIGGTATCIAQAVCDDCGQPYGEKAEHDYKEATCSAPMVCKVCRHTSGSPADHKYTDPTCTADSVCSDCGKVGQEKLGHSWSDELLHDDNKHWYECTSCEAKNATESHHGGEATCDTLASCEDCGVQYGTYAEHVCDAPTCTTASVCEVCHTTIEEALDHNWKSNYSYDDDAHWYECTRCIEVSGYGEHTGGEPTSTSRAICEICGCHYGEEVQITIDWQTAAVFPEVDSTVVLANSDVYGWYSDYDFRSTHTDVFWLEKDIFQPVIPKFKWTVGEEARYYKLYISKNADMTSATCYLTNTTEVDIEHLFVNTDYYWYVDAVYADYTVRSDVFTFKTAPTPRTVDIDGVSNARDLGGYITVDGLKIRQGMIYRSAKLDDITELGMYTLVNILGVKTDLDLRGDKATQPVSALNHIATACPWYADGSNYIWMNDANKAEFANTIKVFANPDNYPIIFHCSLGRDRTGTVAMVLGGLLGLDENTLMMEYELSVFSLWGTNGGTKYETGLRDQIHRTYLYIDNNYEGDSFSEKVADFLMEIGVTAEEIQSIKDIMLEEVN